MTRQPLESTQSATFGVSALLTLGIAVFFLVPSPALAQASEDPWTVLNEDTGWLFLGLFEQDSWMSYQTFELVDQPAAKDEVVIPRPGDVVTLLRDRELWILGYKPKSSELRASESPIKAARLGDDDRTNLWCKKGARLQVNDVQIGPSETKSQELWVRVSPLR